MRGTLYSNAANMAHAMMEQPDVSIKRLYRLGNAMVDRSSHTGYILWVPDPWGADADYNSDTLNDLVEQGVLERTYQSQYGGVWRVIPHSRDDS